MQPLPASLDPRWTVQAGPESVAQRQDWWRALDDTTLDALVVHAVSASPTLQSAAAKVAQAAAQARVSGALRAPQAGASGALDFYRLPPELAQRLRDIDPSITYAKLQIGGSWELDFWGRAKNAARADAYAHLGAEQAYRAALVSLIGQLANAYITYRTGAARLAIAQAAASAREQGLALADARHRDGASDAGDPAQARIAARQQDAQVATLAAAVAEARHAVTLLAGMTEGEAAALLDRPAPIPAAPPPPDPGVPRDLLRARPDVMEAELAARSQYARLKSAKASLYPSFSLSGAIGFSATTIGASSLSDLFNWDKRLVSNGLSFTLPLFDHGKLKGQIQVQDAAFEQALQGYEQAVLMAQRDVADALAQVAAGRQTLAALSAAATASAQQQALAAARYRAGSGTRQDILSAQLTDASLRDALVQAQGDAANAFVALNRALGLGARAQGLPSPLSPETRARMDARSDWGPRLDPIAGAHDPEGNQ